MSFKQHRKTLQLCRQIAETLQLVLGSDSQGDQLLGLCVESVVPAPNASRLLVTVSSAEVTSAQESQAVLQELSAQTGRLRAEIAAAINRKRVPSIVFHVVRQQFQGECEA